MRLRELADRIGGGISGDPDVEITGVSGIEGAQEGDITLFLDTRRLKDFPRLKASAVIVKEEVKGCNLSMLVSDNPQFTFARALEVFHVTPVSPAGVSDRACIGSSVHMGEDVSIHPFACISDNATLGHRVTIASGTFIGSGVSIGEDSFIHPNVTIRENVRIGSKVIVHSGTVIGSDGYGYVFEKGHHYKIPQVGGVEIGDNVEIGANVCIDRGTTGNTTIGSGTKIDNLVQIAHNVLIGKNCIIVGQVGISGSVTVGDGAVLAGQVGIRDHIKIGKGAVIGAQSGIIRDVPDGQVYTGNPAMPHKIWLRAQSLYEKLPDVVKRLHNIETRLYKEEKSDDEHS